MANNLADIHRLKKQYNFKFSKSLGQNFLTNDDIIEEIAEGSFIEEEDFVLEIGPGMGVLTKVLAEKSKQVVAVEIDSTLIPLLEKSLSFYKNVDIVNKDILKTDIDALVKEKRKDDHKGNVRIVGNLPYYITTPIIMYILENGVKAESITAMMQKEVADRLMAKAGTKDYGAISVVVNYYCEVKKVVSVGKENFYPVPKVDSTVLRLDIRKEKPVDLIDEKLFFECVKAGFGQRRKTMANSLSKIRGLGKEGILEILSQVGIDPKRRAETMDLQEFANLSNKIAEFKKRGI